MIVVLTDPRRPAHLAAALAGVDSSARGSRVVLVDGTEAPQVPAGWRVELAPKPAHAALGENRWTTWRAFEMAAEAGDDLVLLEDDAVGCKNAALYAETFVVPTDCALVMLYAPWGDATFPHGVLRMHALNFSFCQALKVPLATCRALAGARAEMEAGRAGGSDEAIQRIGEPRGWMVGIHYPGLYQHVGMESLVSADRDLRGPRSSRAWFASGDAMVLRALRGRNFYL